MWAGWLPAGKKRLHGQVFILTENQPWLDLTCINTTSVNAHVPLQGEGEIKAFLSEFSSLSLVVFI